MHRLRPPLRAWCRDSRGCLLVQAWSSSRGPNVGARFLLDRPVTSAGRHPGSNIFLDDVTVSRRHAEFRVEDGEFWVFDVGSLNGTYVNREPVDSVALAGGDEIQIGKFRLLFMADAADH
jgi:pSer/pThr/pTyr-binding forkhead associated (FHA) protein